MRKVLTPKIYYYPLILISILIVLSILKISGTSIGAYHQILYGKNTRDSNLILNQPREIRSDEWRVITQTIIAQKEAGFPRINQNYNEGQDMSLISDAPYLEWSELFKPQNFAFFIIPLENAFAFKWWFLLVLLLLSIYFLCLKITSNKVYFAILISLVAGFSPFVFWWYQSSTLLCLAYGAFIALFGMHIIDRSRTQIFRKKLSTRASLILNTGTFTYLLTAFALLLYPPFQIPVAIVVGFFLLGYLLDSIVSNNKNKKDIAILIAPFLCAVAITGIICATFVLTRSDVVDTISNTAYPGKRSVPSGGYNINYLLTTYLQPQLINNNSQTNYYFNQSEESSFILLPLFFIVPLIFILIALYLQKKKIDWIIVGLLLPVLIILAHLFVPWASPLTKLFFLHLVPIERAIIGLGLSAILICIYLAKLYYQKIITLTDKLHLAIIVYTVIFTAIAIAYGIIIHQNYLSFIPSKKLLLLYALIVYAGLYLFLRGKVVTGMIILALFSVFTVWQIHPLYVGLGDIYNHKLTNAIKEVSTKDDIWGVADDVRFENLPQMSNRKAVTGVAFYPDLSFWKKYSESNDQAVYNRYAHIVLDQKTTQPILLVQKDIFVASTQCSRRLVSQLDFILSTSLIRQSCYGLIKTIKYPAQNFYIYKTRH